MSEQTDWFVCGDVKIMDDDGSVIYAGPNFLRCMNTECGSLVTHGGYQADHACRKCGNRRLKPCQILSEEEIRDLRNYAYKLTWWEEEMIFGGANDC